MKLAGAAMTLCLELWGGSAQGAAFNPAGVDIQGLRLGMTEPAVMGELERQGLRTDRIVRMAEACATAPRCDATLTVATRDGDLRLVLSGQPLVVRSIAYTFRGRAAGEPAIIAEAVLQRFGPPDQPEPMMWCQPPGPGGGCAGVGPSLRFIRETLTLILGPPS